VNIGIVGAGADKFTPETAERACAFIRQLLSQPNTVLVSGRSPVGGIDVWAEEIADELCIQKIIYAPEVEQWNPPGQYGHKARNLDIAKDSEVVYVIVVGRYPPSYEGQKFDVCYHCARLPDNDGKGHVKSGGCWTAIQAQKMGKTAIWWVIDNDL